MSILVLQIFVSLCLVAGSVALYVFTVRARTFEHSDRLALAPLDDDERCAECSSSGASPGAGPRTGRTGPETTAPQSEPNRILRSENETGSGAVRPQERS